MITLKIFTATSGRPKGASEIPLKKALVIQGGIIEVGNIRIDPWNMLQTK